MRLAGLLALLTVTVAAAQDNRFYAASQYAWGEKTGFYLDFECSPKDGAPCRLADLRLILGLADGANWRFCSTAGPWQLDHDYQAKAVFDGTQGELWLDGRSVGRIDGGWVPGPGGLAIAEVPSWANGPADYFIRQSAVKAVAGGASAQRDLPAGRVHPALELFGSAPAQHLDFTAAKDAQVTVEIAFRLAARPDPRALAPLIDAFGQNRYADWPDKVRDEAQLKRDTAAEPGRLPEPPAGFDRWGGWLASPWQEPATGFYRTVRRDGRFWLLSPEGHPCFYLGLCGVPTLTWETTPVTGREWLFEWLPPRQGPLAAAWSKDQWGTTDGTEYVCFHAANQVRAYGDDWQAESGRRAVRRVKAWGFSGAAKWGHQDGLAETPVLNRWGVPELVKRPDVFDPATREAFRACLARQVEPRRSDPSVVGWTVGSEIDEIIQSPEIVEILTKHGDSAAAKAMVAHAVATIYGGDAARQRAAWADGPAKADIEPLRRFYADAYYGYIYRTLGELDPNHLRLGNYIVPGWWENEEDWRLIARHADVISYDRYAWDFTDAQMDKLIRETDKPIFCGEFAYPPFYDGQRGFGRYPVWADSDAQAGELYSGWVDKAIASPWCVGVCWFMYRDQPLTGRGPGRGGELVYNEHYAFGMVDGCDRPKWELVGRVREVNATATARRLALPASAVASDPARGPQG